MGYDNCGALVRAGGGGGLGGGGFCNAHQTTGGALLVALFALTMARMALGSRPLLVVGVGPAGGAWLAEGVDKAGVGVQTGAGVVVGGGSVAAGYCMTGDEGAQTWGDQTGVWVAGEGVQTWGDQTGFWVAGEGVQTGTGFGFDHVGVVVA